MLNKCLLNGWKILQKYMKNDLWGFDIGGWGGQWEVCFCGGDDRLDARSGWGERKAGTVIIPKEREFSGLGNQLFECKVEWLGWPAWNRHIGLVAPFTEVEEERRDGNFWRMAKTSLVEFQICHPSVLCGTHEQMLTISMYYGVHMGFTVSLPSEQPWSKHTIYLQFLPKSK